MVQNAVQNGAEHRMKSINIHGNGINKTFSNHETNSSKGQNSH
ncbi:hypothetical protein HMPREF0670_00818 [Prevotella sp. oral taxon 317 str. F0108]|nr:hypothetical protein HMPREF0670_00818 [Prevotella sp. oral taxon 317 str. F0108]